MAGEWTRLASLRLRRVLWEWLAVGALASALAIFLAASPLSSAFDRTLYDTLVQLKGRAPSDAVLIVAIDDASLREMGPWPWPHAVHARLIDTLTKAGVRALAYDVLFLEPDPKGGDAALAEALRRSGRTVLPVLHIAPGEDGRTVRTVPPIPVLAASAAALGQVNIAPDGDEVVRRASTRVASEGQCWSQLGVEALRIARSQPPSIDCDGLAAASARTSAMLATLPALIPFAGPPGRFRTLPAGAVLRGEAPPALLRDRIVLVGATAAGLGDRHPTAASGRKGAMAGVELQANLLDAAVSGARIRALPWWAVGGGAVALVWTLLAGLMRLKPRAGLVILAALIGFTLVVSLILFQLGWWASPQAAIAALALAYPLWSWRRLAVTSAALQTEIGRFDQEAAPAGPGFGADLLSTQVDTLAGAAQRLRDLYALVADTLRSLPDPTVALDQHGVIQLANDLASVRAGGQTVAGQTLPVWLGQVMGGPPAHLVVTAFAAGAVSVEVTASDGADIEASRAPIQGLSSPEPWTIVRLVDVSTIRRAIRQREEALQLLTHDIRAPFASISALIGATGGEASPDILSRIDAYAARGRAMAESYVQLARAHNADWKATVFDLRDCAGDAADEIWAVAHQRGVEVRLGAPEDEMLVHGDRGLLTRAIMNLVENAVRYSAAGGVVEIACTRLATGLELAVLDRGPGVDPAILDRLFQRFVRGADGANTGAGLGLAIAALSVQRMGGTLVHESRPGGGAIFRLTLPAAELTDG